MEKLSPAVVVARLARIAPHVKGAATGVTLSNAADYARAGAHLLVSAALHFAPLADVCWIAAY